MMGKGKTRKVEKGVAGGNSSGGYLKGCGSFNVPSGPVFYPTEEEFKDPLEYVYKIRPEAEPYGICKIVPPKSWNPPFALDKDSFTFPTKTQAIHQLQARCASCDPKTFELEYNRFLEDRCGKKAKKRVVFEGEELDLCKLFNAVKRFGGYDSVAKMKKWGEVFRFVRPGKKIPNCSKHVLSLLYLEYLYDYEEYVCKLKRERNKSCKRSMIDMEPGEEVLGSKRRRRNKEGQRVNTRKIEDEELDQICEQCKSGLHGEVMLLCDRCNKGWHIYCLSPPLKKIPPGNWYCLDCLNSEKDSFGFVPGKQFPMEAFKRVADRVKKKWFGTAATSRMQLERKFWEIVEGSAGEVEVMYGSDLDTSIYGSGFPRLTDERPTSVETDIWNQYCLSPWNLNNLPRLEGSMLRTVHHNIAGVMVPWLYIGMLFSAFCWHFEDHCFYSMNYHHWGEPKCWYSVPGSEALAFEKVMQNSLPDLFEAQPDLLFQLITMLNPSVLQEKGVPVYSIIQEPGNFVITFPRSYHGGFNFGLNCAEAVNFAPADWLPHGGFAAELYRHYHKAAVLSHEELLCVVAESEFDGKVSTYLKKELLRIYNSEKTWREQLWRNGMIRSSRMTPREQPEYVGVEEDPVCVICQQSLYLSAVSCACRPSAFVCLEHWEHLCECKPDKLRLLYRHTLAELSNLLLKVDKQCSVEAAGDSLKELHSDKAMPLVKKVKGAHMTHMQLAEEWILRSCKILEHPYSKQAYITALEEAEQFLWAGFEMDTVRETENNFIEAQNWAEAVIDCLSKVKLRSNDSSRGTEQISVDRIEELLGLSKPPCNEPSHLELKEYQHAANKMIDLINSALSSTSDISPADLEILYAKAVDLPIGIKETEKLKNKLSALQIWLDTVRKCISQKASSLVDKDMLYNLESEIKELRIQLPEADLLKNLIMQVETCQSQCQEILRDSISLKEVEVFLHEWENFSVNIPELTLLRTYYSETMSWISHVNLVLMNVHERDDQENLIDELTCILRDGSLLHIEVDELPRIEIELEKSRCRVKALEARRCKMSMDLIQQLLLEATNLQIEKEKPFHDVFQIHAVAVDWEEKAKNVLANEVQMSKFEDILRASEDICVILPSLPEVKEAVSTAKAWLMRSRPFLFRDVSTTQASDCRLQINSLKELVLESKKLKVYLEDCSLLDDVLKKCVGWERDACSLLEDVKQFWTTVTTGEGITSGLISRFECQVVLIESTLNSGTALGLEFTMMPKLQDAYSVLKWCIKALSFSTIIPTCEEVKIMLDTGANLPEMYKSSDLWVSLIEGLNWLKKALEILDINNRGQYQVTVVEEVLMLSEKAPVSFPMVVSHLRDAVQTHQFWLERVHLFFALSCEDRSLNELLELKGHGVVVAFGCEELERILSGVEKALQWQQRSEDLVKPYVAKANPFLGALVEIKSTVQRSLDVYSNAKNGEAGNLCACCFNSTIDCKLLVCSICRASFHLQCARSPLDDAMMFVCPYCDFIKSSKPRHGGFLSPRTGQKHLELDKLVTLLSDANDLYLWTEERRMLCEIVEKALACNACLTELVGFSLSYVSKDLDVVTQKMSIALKAVDVACVRDSQENHKLTRALLRHSWKIGAQTLLGSGEKPTIQQIERHLKDGLDINIPAEDHFKRQLTELRDMGLQWADLAKKVAGDGGALGLNRVFELISKGESLPVSCRKELKLLKDRSMLYCICRKPYDQRAMIACDKCDEWYHFDCVKISSAPKVYICPACKLHPDEDVFPSASALLERCAGSKFEEPQTPLRRVELRTNSHGPASKKRAVRVDITDILTKFSVSERLLWRNRKPSRRAARRRSELKSLSPFFYVQDNINR